MYDILIVGAGLTSATICSQLKHKYKILVVDIRDHLAGNCHDYLFGNYYIQKYGPHIFHTKNDAVLNLLSSYTKWIPYTHKVDAELDDGRHVPFPYSKETEVYTGKLSEQDIIDTFFKPYSYKMWGVDWDSLPDVIRNRVPKHAKETSNYFPDQFSGLPANGYSAFIKDMFSGVDVLLGVDKDAWQQIKAKKVIYCGRPDQIRLKQNMRVGDVGNRWLEYRSLKITLKLEKWTNKSTVVNFCHYKNNFTRKSCLQSAYMPQHSSDTIVTYEQPVGVDNNDPTPFYYFPTEYNDTKNSLINDIIKEEYPNIIMAGRLGTSKYIDMDAAVAMGIDISNKLK